MRTKNWFRRGEEVEYRSVRRPRLERDSTTLEVLSGERQNHVMWSSCGHHIVEQRSSGWRRAQKRVVRAWDRSLSGRLRSPKITGKRGKM